MNETVNPPTPDPPPQPVKKPLWHWPLHISHHTAIILMRVTMGLLVIAAIGITGLAYLLAQGPVRATPALTIIENALEAGGGDVRYDIGDLYVTWQGRGRPLGLEFRNVTLIGPRGPFLSIEKMDAGLSLARLLIADVHFAYAVVDNLSMRLVRLEDGQITLIGGEKTAAEDTEKPAVLRLEDIVRDLPDIRQLSFIRLNVQFDDRKVGAVHRFEDVRVDLTQTRTPDGRSLNGFVTTNLGAGGDESPLTLDFMYEPADKTLSVMGRLDNTKLAPLAGDWLKAAGLPEIDITMEGRAQIRLSNTLSLQSLALRLKGEDGRLIWPENYGPDLEDQDIYNVDFQVAFDPEAHSLELVNAELTLKGITLKASGHMTASADWSKMEGPLNLEIPVLAVDVLPAVWPASFEPNARKWLVDRMDKGRFSNIAVSVPLSVTKNQSPQEGSPAWVFATGKVMANFEFTDVTVNYREPLSPTIGSTGTGVFEGLSLTLDITAARMGGLRITKGRMFFDDLITPGKGHADLYFELNGPVRSVFDYLDKEPIAYRRKVSFDGSQAQGQADLTVKIDFPATKDMKVEDVKVQAKGTLTNVTLPKVVKNALTVSGGPFALEASANHFKLDGTGRLEGQPATLMWHELFAPDAGIPFTAKLEADMVTNEAIRAPFLGAVAARVQGPVPARVTLETKADGTSRVNVQATLDQARVDFTNPFNTIKEAGQPSKLTLTAILKNNYLQSLEDISARGSGLSLTTGRLSFGRDKDGDPALASASLTGLKLGRTNASLEATWPTPSQLTATVTGASFDAGYILGPGEDGAAAPLSFNASLDVGALHTTPQGTLTQAKGQFVGTSGGLLDSATLTGVAGGQPVTLSYNAQGLNWTAGDAGAALLALGVTDRVRGGTLRVTGSPKPGGQRGDMAGNFKLDKFSVRNAPAIAKLVNVLSVPGLLNLLNADTGLSFERAQADIVWLNRPGGGIVQLEDGRTSGASLGLTFEGEVNTGTDKLAIEGTVIPLSEVNKLVSGIPIIGDILTGGKGKGIFAATYSMKGDSADPDVTVNPLSVLTPGILRTLLFEGGTPKTDAAPPGRPNR